MRATAGRFGGLVGRVVLVLDDGWSHTSVSGAVSLVRAGCRVVNGSPVPGLLARTRASHEWVEIRDPAHDAAGFVADVRTAIDRFDVDLVVPTSDREAFALASSGLPLAAATAPGPAVLEAMFDKGTLAERAAGVGLHPPATTRVAVGSDGALGALGAHATPVIVKPALHWAPGARGGFHAAVVCDGAAEVACAVAALHAGGVDAIVQELVPGPVVSIAMVLDRSGALVALGQMDAELLIRGSTVTGRTTGVERDVADRLHRMLVDAGWFGCAQFDLIRDERSGALRPIDFNGRWFMSMAGITAAGCDLPVIAAAVALGLPVSGCARAVPGVRFRWPQAMFVKGMHEHDPRLLASALVPRRNAVPPYAVPGSRLAVLRHDVHRVVGEAKSAVRDLRGR